MKYNDKEYQDWVSELKRNKDMVPVFHAKLKDAEKELQEQKIKINNIHRKYANQMGDEFTRIRLASWSESIIPYEKEVAKWKYLKKLASGKIDESKQVDIEELKERVRIESLLDVPYKQRGRTMINCPIHNEDTPSCCVYHGSNSFYCYGCHTGGSVIDVLIKRDGLSIKEAVNLLTGM